MQYTVLIWTEADGGLPEAEAAAIDLAVQEWVRDLSGRGILLHDQRLSEPADATTVQVRGGEVLYGDGPFAETKEQIAGFVVIEAPDLDGALELVAANPLSAIGTLEVRPHWTP